MVQAVQAERATPNGHMRVSKIAAIVRRGPVFPDLATRLAPTPIVTIASVNLTSESGVATIADATPPTASLAVAAMTDWDAED